MLRQEKVQIKPEAMVYKASARYWWIGLKAASTTLSGFH